MSQKCFVKKLVKQNRKTETHTTITLERSEETTTPQQNGVSISEVQ